MKFRKALLVLALSKGILCAIPCAADAQQLTPAQLSQVKRGYGMFIHFGINTAQRVYHPFGFLHPEIFGGGF
jgi:hypothetical protein